MDMVAEVAVEELERIFPDFKFNKEKLWIVNDKRKSEFPFEWLNRHPEYKALSPTKQKKVDVYVNFIVTMNKPEKSKQPSRSGTKKSKRQKHAKACPV